MDQVLAQAKLEVSPTAKAWEPQRAYEKRLTTVMSKDKRMTSLSRFDEFPGLNKCSQPRQ